MRKLIVIGGLALAFVFGFTAASALQEGEMGGGEQEQHAPPPPLEDKWLDLCVGEWEWTGKMWMEGQEMPYMATEKVEWKLNHQFLVTHYTAPMGPGQPSFEGLGIQRSTPDTNEYTLWWFDINGEPSVFKGKLEGDTLVATADVGKRKMRMTTTFKKDGTATAHMQMQMPGQDGWSDFFKVEGKKKGGS